MESGRVQCRTVTCGVYLVDEMKRSYIYNAVTQEGHTAYQ